MNFRKLITFILIIGSNSLIFGQGYFEGHLVFGTNAAQLDGDELAGYHKLGLNTGLRVAFPVAPRFDFNIEMLYSQKGSQSQLDFGNAPESRKTRLNYLDVPLYIMLNDWWQEDGKYYKVHAHTGLSAGYLFSVSSDNGLFLNDIENFKKYEVSYLVGVSYAFTRNWIFLIRYTTSLGKIYKSPTFGVDALRSYYLTFRLDYKF